MMHAPAMPDSPPGTGQLRSIIHTTAPPGSSSPRNRATCSRPAPILRHLRPVLSLFTRLAPSCVSRMPGEIFLSHIQ